MEIKWIPKNADQALQEKRYTELRWVMLGSVGVGDSLCVYTDANLPTLAITVVERTDDGYLVERW